MKIKTKTLLSLGVMTGTSCDGADLALLRIARGPRGDIRETFLGHGSFAFPSELRKQLLLAQTGVLRISPLLVLQKDYSRFLSDVIRRWIKSQKVSANKLILGVHGQTIWHQPEDHVSAQLLDPALISYETGCTVLSGFRQPDLARGGQGAPLVPLYHWLRAQEDPFRSMLPFAIHNVGGIANVTAVGRSKNHLMAFDTGPGNALIDLAVERLTEGKQRFDRDGKIAAGAMHEVDWSFIESLARQSYFQKAPPKSTGRELFNEGFLRQFHAQKEKLVAVATAFSAHTMALAYAKFVCRKIRVITVFVAGGGAKNPTLLKAFSRELARLTGQEITVAPLPDRFCPPQALEAAAFARLAYEALQASPRHPTVLRNVTGAKSDSFGASIFPGKSFRALIQSL